MRKRSVGGNWSEVIGGGWSGSVAGMVGVRRGDMEGEVGVGRGLNDTKKTALVSAPDTFCRWMRDGVRSGWVQRGTWRRRRMDKTLVLNTGWRHSLRGVSVCLPRLPRQDVPSVNGQIHMLDARDARWVLPRRRRGRGRAVEPEL